MKRRKVILVNPRMCRPSSVRLPLSLLALGAVLENRWEYEIFDGNLDALPLHHPPHEQGVWSLAIAGPPLMI